MDDDPQEPPKRILVHSGILPNEPDATALAESQDAAVRAAANLLRVVRGAGKPTRIVHDASELIIAFTAYAKAHSNGAYPGYEVAQWLQQAWQLNDTEIDSWAKEAVIRGALQVVASRLLGQRVQERTGWEELMRGVEALK
ncbi:hypothetical protein [Sphingopyxis sp. FD7]|jgi:hypothetical protein|uniref:hypothetical protein n=1 Tax=Sphingopyxis sp. FD7 TaxID=1914525 RepID=UPI000DC620B7|nr:hypothetical protein [Sphingopyxis sp. FD7]BBB12938.1 hypothetical protein SPYCA_2196 [Sphingopyxis sp. FD7]